MHLSGDQESFWNSYLETLKDQPVDPRIDVGMAGDSSNANELLELFLTGKKTAGSSLICDYELSGDSLPSEGNYWIVLDLDHKPRCILKTTKVETFIFKDIPEHIALAEGEKSPEKWKHIHSEFFEPYLESLGVEDLNLEPVITEFYELVYKD